MGAITPEVGGPWDDQWFKTAGSANVLSVK